VICSTDEEKILGEEDDLYSDSYEQVSMVSYFFKYDLLYRVSYALVM
jgi:hypothetical protein